MSIGERIRLLRKELNLSQNAFAERSKISLRALKAYELDEREPPASFLVEVYQQFNVEPTWLLSGDGARSAEHRSNNVEHAVIAVRTFAILEKVDFPPEKEAKLVLLLAEYFDEGGENDGPLVKKILENAV